jgi:hypothetical protein
LLVDEFCNFCKVGSDLPAKDIFFSIGPKDNTHVVAAIHSCTHNGDFHTTKKLRKGDVLVATLATYLLFATGW